MSLAYFQQHIDEALDILNADVVCITRDNGANAMLISESDWRSLQETLHLLANPINAARLNASMQQSGDTAEFESPPK